MQKPCTTIYKCTHRIYQDLVHHTMLTPYNYNQIGDLTPKGQWVEICKKAKFCPLLGITVVIIFWVTFYHM
jgi:hypothetical protein